MKEKFTFKRLFIDYVLLSILLIIKLIVFKLDYFELTMYLYIGILTFMFIITMLANKKESKWMTRLIEKRKADEADIEKQEAELAETYRKIEIMRSEKI